MSKLIGPAVSITPAIAVLIPNVAKLIYETDFLDGRGGGTIRIFLSVDKKRNGHYQQAGHK
jgi:hypothetical protein